VGKARAKKATTRAKKPAACQHSAVRCQRIGRPAILAVRGGWMPPGTMGLVCHVCGVRLPLGPSNDDSPAVQVEMRAAEIAQVEGDAMSQAEAIGYAEHPCDGVISDEHAAGWLSSEIDTHFEHDHRDIEAWPWDPTRPLAGQYEEKSCPVDHGHAKSIAALADGIVEAGGELPYLGARPDASGEPWSCPDGSSECEILRQCTNKCGRKDTQAEIDANGPAYDAINDAFDAEDADLQAGGPALTDAEVRAYAADCPDHPGTPTDLDGDCLECLDETAISEDAADQAAYDRYDGEHCVVELLVGEEPERGVEFEVETYSCAASHDDDCQTAAWDDGPLVCVVQLRTMATPEQERRVDELVDAAGGITALRERAVRVLDAMEYKHTRSAEPDCRDEDGPEVERIMAEMAQ